MQEGLIDKMTATHTVATVWTPLYQTLGYAPSPSYNILASDIHCHMKG